LSSDPFNLNRFVKAQAPVFDTALNELRDGRKRTHWMWFVFPQLKGLGLSPTAQFYGLCGRTEAIAYLDHPVLAPRLDAAVNAVDASGASSLHQLFGSPDDLKFCSSMTLFSTLAPSKAYREAITRWCSNQSDQRTLDLLAQEHDR